MILSLSLETTTAVLTVDDNKDDEKNNDYADSTNNDHNDSTEKDNDDERASRYERESV